MHRSRLLQSRPHSLVCTIVDLTHGPCMLRSSPIGQLCDAEGVTSCAFGDGTNRKSMWGEALVTQTDVYEVFARYLEGSTSPPPPTPCSALRRSWFDLASEIGDRAPGPCDGCHTVYEFA